MSPARSLRRRAPVAILLAASLLASCGSAEGPGTAGPPADAGGAPGAPGQDAGRGAVADEPRAPLPSRLVTDYVPPRAAPRVARADPAVEACVEREIHTRDYDAMGPRDARRKLRRLQLQADCQEHLAAR